MKRYQNLLLSCVILGLSGCGEPRTRGDATQPITLNYANFPPASTFPCIQMVHWKEEVEKRTGGKLKINLFPGGTLLGAKEIFDGVIAGSADIGNFAMSYQPGRFPVSEAIDLPHFFKDAKTASVLLADLLETFNPAEFAQVKVLTAFTCPPAVIMSAKEVTQLTDLTGLTLRSSGTGSEIIKQLGAAPVAMPQSDVPDALQKGVVKGNVSSAEVLKDMNYAAYCPFVYQANLSVISFAVVMNRERYEALPADIRLVLDALYHEQAEWTGAYVDQHAADALEWSVQKYQLVIHQPTEVDAARLRTLAKPLMTDYCERVSLKDVNGQAVLDFIEKKLTP